jgi:hypothetical protein
MSVQPGSDRHRLRRFHQAMALVQHMTIPMLAELLPSLEPVSLYSGLLPIINHPITSDDKRRLRKKLPGMVYCCI